MENIIAIIPARGGSKGIPQKNIKMVAGKPLIAHTLEQSNDSIYIKKTVVSTDDPDIKKISEKFGALIIDRPKKLSGDEATSVSALQHALEILSTIHHINPDLLVLLQCTSPIRNSSDIDNAIRQFISKNADSMLSVCPSHKFLWKKQGKTASSINFDFQNRPRRQDASPQFVENGSIYICKPWVLKQYNNILGGIIDLYIMDESSAWEIDTPFDLYVVEQILLKKLETTNTDTHP
jgi:CMP-N,N'-diacetyllegionaminic acid synthase